MAQRLDPPLALQRYHEALQIEPEIGAYAVGYGSAPPFERIDRVRELLEEAVRLDPALAPAHAALANVLARQRHILPAIAGYRRALDIDPRQPEAALAVSELLFDIDQTAQSQEYREYALSQQCLYPPSPHADDAPCNVLALNAPAPWPQNTPLDIMIDPHAVALHRLYLTDDSLPDALPHYDVVFTAIGEAERAHDAIARAQRFISSQAKRVVNQPKHLWKTARPNLPGALEGVYGCATVRTTRIARRDLVRCDGFPLLIRPIDTHAGYGLERIEDAAGLAAYLQSHDDERFDVTPFVEYRSRDGYYRKYRIVLVDGTPYPYHLAISPEWMVHYVKTPTASVGWMRAEEEQFLREPQSVFANWERTFSEMAQALELDYVGVDCAIMPGGRVLVFEADTALLIHCREPADSYKHRYVPRIFRAVERLLQG